MSSHSANRVLLRDLPSVAEFELGSLSVSPARRLLMGPAGSRSLQPHVMAVLLCLAQRLGLVITRRELFESCWGNAPVGDDSLNRALSAIRQALVAIGATDVSVETIPRTGYRLAVTSDVVSTAGRGDRAVEAAYDCWRAGLPKPDREEIDALAAQLDESSGRAADWGILALLLRKAAEYSDAADCASYVSRCEKAARRALSIQPQEPNALVALAGVIPLIGNWTDVRMQLSTVLEVDPSHAPARHDFAVLEMATGRPSAAVPLIEQLLAQDGLAASFHYKRMYHLWTLGDLKAAEQAAIRALQLWPHHPAIWSARFWTLVFTGRAEQAVSFGSDANSRPVMPPAVAEFLTSIARAVCDQQAGHLSPEAWEGQVQRSMEAASWGPAGAVSALLGLCALEAIDAAFVVARAYYVGSARTAVPLRWNPTDHSITDQHRRVTQPLFIPAATALRADPRFMSLCEDIGLVAYWQRFQITPDFLQN